MKDRSDDPLHHEQTLLPQSYISLPDRERERDVIFYLLFDGHSGNYSRYFQLIMTSPSHFLHFAIIFQNYMDLSRREREKEREKGEKKK